MRIFYSLVVAAILVSCASDTETTSTTDNNTNTEQNDQEELSKLLEYTDPHSFSKPEEAVVTHLEWDAEVDFESKTITAKASWQIEHERNEIHFDAHNLEIQKVTVGKEDEKEVEFQLGEKVKYLGQDLMIPLEENTEWVNIYYKTTEGADALQFLDPN